jgi:hypothetical protein
VSADDSPAAGGGVQGGPDPERIADRVAVRLPVEFELDTSQGAQPGFTSDLSRTGMFLAFNAPPPVGTMARFCVRRTDGSEVRGIGEITWIRVRWSGKGRPPGMGIRFRYLDKASQSSLESVVEEALARGLKIDAASEEAEPDPDEPVMPVRRYGKPLMMSQSLSGRQKPAPSTPRPAPAQASADGDAKGWESLRKWANSPTPLGVNKEVGAPSDGLGRTATPFLGNLSDKSKLIVFGVLAVILLLVLAL